MAPHYKTRFIVVWTVYDGIYDIELRLFCKNMDKMYTMRQTRKHSRMHSIHGIPMHASTFHGLHEWYDAIFEKLGWMVLAKEKGYGYKIPVYKKSIQHLLESIQHVMSEYSEADRKHDLAVLHMHTLCLKDFVQKHL